LLQWPENRRGPAGYGVPVPFWLQAALEVGGFWLAVVLVGRLTGAIRLAYLWLAVVVLLVVALILQGEGVRSAGLAALGLFGSLAVMTYAFGFTRDMDDVSDDSEDMQT
jgi:hypothetical protein